MGWTDFFQRLTLRKNEFDSDDPRVAAVALSYYLIDADGLENTCQYKRLTDTLKNLYGIDGVELKQLLESAEYIYKSSLEISTFTDTIKLKLNKEERIEFIRFLFDLAYCDGHVYELEDNVIWRIATMIDVDDTERKQQKHAAATARHIQL